VYSVTPYEGTDHGTFTSVYSVTPALGHRHGNLTSVYSVTPSLAKQLHFNITRPAATASYIAAATPHLAPYRPDEGSLASQPTRHSLVTTCTRATPHFSFFSFPSRSFSPYRRLGLLLAHLHQFSLSTFPT
jgi:hypothetical protein